MTEYPKLVTRTAKNIGGTRPLSGIKWIVDHETQSGTDTADGVVSYFATNPEAGSTQLVVDFDDAYRCVPDNRICAGASGANTQGLHIERCAYSSWSDKVFRQPKNLKTLRVAAHFIARWCIKYKIPPRWVDWKGLQRGEKGITAHYEVSQAFHISTHTDGVRGFRKAYLLRHVRLEYDRLKKG